ncbi:hypothetical protein CGMCC3_g2662 [Colletotrichum fructicola]|nr:uncharacterized protein CGMCC3_g2662 [Colletotrichum fructicola]KAE9581582.1 hypothetical protein CGMCC3_g2662 [Colletotrichum fructicola]
MVVNAVVDINDVVVVAVGAVVVGAIACSIIIVAVIATGFIDVLDVPYPTSSPSRNMSYFQVDASVAAVPK